MELKIQIISILFSLFYGFLFGILYNLFYNFLYKSLLRYKILINILFNTNVFLVYFIIMLKINNGNIKIPFLILLFFSFILTINNTKKLRKIVKCLKTKN